MCPDMDDFVVDSECDNSPDIIILCELVEEYRQEIANASGELLTLSDELLLSNSQIKEQKIQLLSAESMVADLEDSICFLDDELKALRHHMETVVSLLSTCAPANEILEGLRSIMSVESDAEFVNSIEEHVNTRDRTDNRVRMSRETSQLDEIAALKARVSDLEEELKVTASKTSSIPPLLPSREVEPSVGQAMIVTHGREEVKGRRRRILRQYDENEDDEEDDQNMVISMPYRRTSCQGTDSVPSSPARQMYTGIVKSSCTVRADRFERPLLSVEENSNEIKSKTWEADRKEIDGRKLPDLQVLPDNEIKEPKMNTDRLPRNHRPTQRYEEIEAENVDRERLHERGEVASKKCESESKQLQEKEEKNFHSQSLTETERRREIKEEKNLEEVAEKKKKERQRGRAGSAVAVVLQRIRTNTGRAVRVQDITDSGDHIPENSPPRTYSTDKRCLPSTDRVTTNVQIREQRYLHEEWIGTSSNSPEKENKKGRNSQEKEDSSDAETAGRFLSLLPSRTLPPSAMLQHTPINESTNTTSSSHSSRDSSRRISRPVNFSHPVLLNDSEGAFFDRSDLRHSDSRSCSSNAAVIPVRSDSRIWDVSRSVNSLDLYGTDDDDDDDNYRGKNESDNDDMNRNRKNSVTFTDPKQLKTIRRSSRETLSKSESKRNAW